MWYYRLLLALAVIDLESSFSAAGADLKDGAGHHGGFRLGHAAEALGEELQQILEPLERYLQARSLSSTCVVHWDTDGTHCH